MPIIANDNANLREELYSLSKTFESGVVIPTKVKSRLRAWAKSVIGGDMRPGDDTCYLVGTKGVGKSFAVQAFKTWAGRADVFKRHDSTTRIPLLLIDCEHFTCVDDFKRDLLAELHVT